MLKMKSDSTFTKLAESRNVFEDENLISEFENHATTIPLPKPLICSSEVLKCKKKISWNTPISVARPKATPGILNLGSVSDTFTSSWLNLPQFSNVELGNPKKIAIIAKSKKVSLKIIGTEDKNKDVSPDAVVSKVKNDDFKPLINLDNNENEWDVPIQKVKNNPAETCISITKSKEEDVKPLDLNQNESKLKTSTSVAIENELAIKNNELVKKENENLSDQQNWGLSTKGIHQIFINIEILDSIIQFAKVSEKFLDFVTCFNEAVQNIAERAAAL